MKIALGRLWATVKQHQTSCGAQKQRMGTWESTGSMSPRSPIPWSQAAQCQEGSPWRDFSARGQGQQDNTSKPFALCMPEASVTEEPGPAQSSPALTLAETFLSQGCSCSSGETCPPGAPVAAVPTLWYYNAIAPRHPQDQSSHRSVLRPRVPSHSFDSPSAGL